MSAPLKGKIAVVAGATRGAGRGIARALAEAGAIVYCTGRSTSDAPSEYGRPETISQTARLINDAGGAAIPVRLDHTIEADVERLFARIDSEQERLDIVVDSVAGESPGMSDWGPFWNADLSLAPARVEASLLSHLITAKHAAKRMIGAGRGLIVQVTESDWPLGTGGNALRDLVKSGLKTLAFHLAEELRPHTVASVAVTPGFLRSEMMLDHFGVTEDDWRRAIEQDVHFEHSETPLFLGRGIAALAADPDVAARSGEILSSWQLARDYGVDDVDGTRPDWGAYFTTIMPLFGEMQASLRRQAGWLERMSARCRATTDGSAG